MIFPSHQILNTWCGGEYESNGNKVIEIIDPDIPLSDTEDNNFDLKYLCQIF